jgi:hypothetical protein
MVFLENQKEIESDWHKTFGDRKNEIVIIGQHMNEQVLRQQLDACLSTDDELEASDWRKGSKDQWPVERSYPLPA